MSKSKRPSFSPRDFAITVAVAVVAVGATSFFMSDTGASFAAGTLQSPMVAASASAVSSSTAPYHSISYRGADKGRYGAEVNVYPQGKVPSLELTLLSNSAEIKRLQKYANGGAPAYVTYDVYPGMIDPANMGRVPAMFSSFGSMSLKVSGTKLVGPVPLDFSINLLPGTYYTVVAHIIAADSSFNETSYIYLLSSNEYSMCSLKG